MKARGRGKHRVTVESASASGRVIVKAGWEGNMYVRVK